MIRTHRTSSLLASVLVTGLALVASLAGPRALSAQAVVRTVLFYSPYCPHCHKVMNEDLPPLVERYGQRLVIVGVDVTKPAGQALYQATADHFKIPDDQRGVPLMVVGEEVMMGDTEIPQRLPGLIEQGLAAGGVEFPAVPELRAALDSRGPAAERARAAAERSGAEQPGPPPASAPPASPPTAEPSTAISSSLADAAGTTANMTVVDRLRRDPVGNGVAVVVLVLLVAALLQALFMARVPATGPTKAPGWLVPLLLMIGIGVAAYMSFVEVTGNAAVCGPVGDCNAVQQSAYARLFGVLPVGYLGLMGYIAMFGAWVLWKRGEGAGPLRALWALALAGAAFSAYLTFLEPFVIGATCVWCVTSAVVMALLLVTATAEVRAAVG